MVVSGLFVGWVWCVFGKASHPSNETEMSYRYRERAWLEVEVL
jgi:hypothetical protein